MSDDLVSRLQAGTPRASDIGTIVTLSRKQAQKGLDRMSEGDKKRALATQGLMGSTVIDLVRGAPPDLQTGEPAIPSMIERVSEAMKAGNPEQALDDALNHLQLNAGAAGADPKTAAIAALQVLQQYQRAVDQLGRVTAGPETLAGSLGERTALGAALPGIPGGVETLIDVSKIITDFMGGFRGATEEPTPEP